ncbi:hypothetical protein PUN4_520087 [Paraburkholderia unamae]|nr:hypothetical protein PUN4_520087 [Paraburkholderia unamae]
MQRQCGINRYQCEMRRTARRAHLHLPPLSEAERRGAAQPDPQARAVRLTYTSVANHLARPCISFR